MAEFRAGGRAYRSRLLPAINQWALLARLRPVLPALRAMDAGLRLGTDDPVDFAAMLVPLVSAPDEDLRAVFRACLGACERFEDEGWRPLAEPPVFSDLMDLTTHVVAENFAPLFAMRRPAFKPVVVDRVTYEPATLPDDEDWLFRPVLRGLCRLESLYDGTLRIEQIAKANDALDVENENQARMRKAAENK